MADAIVCFSVASGDNELAPPPSADCKINSLI